MWYFKKITRDGMDGNGWKLSFLKTCQPTGIQVWSTGLYSPWVPEGGGQIITSGNPG